MKIGFTYDLRDEYKARGFSELEIAEFDSLSTIEAVEEALTSLGHTVERIGSVFSLMDLLSKGKRWDMVFNICEGLYGQGREAMVPALLDNFNIPYTFSDPLVHSIILNKGITKRLLKSYDLATTDFMVVTHQSDLREPKAPYPLFVKAIAEGTGKGISPSSIIMDFKSLKMECEKLLKRFRQPVIVEPYLPGREVTVGVLKTGREAYVCGVLNVDFTELADSDIHSYFNKENCEQTCVYTLAEDDFAKACADLALAAHRALRLQDASRVDIKADAHGKPFIMEINSLPGLSPGHSDLVILTQKAGMSYQKLISVILESAAARIAANEYKL